MTFNTYLTLIEEEYEKTGKVWFQSNLYDLYSTLNKNFLALLQNLENSYSNQQKYKQFYDQYIIDQKKILNQQDLGNLFIDIKGLIAQVEGLTLTVEIVELKIPNLVNLLNALNRTFNKIFRNPDDFVNIKIFLDQLIKINSTFETLRDNLSNSKRIMKTIKNKVSVKDNNDRIQLNFFDNDTDYSEFTKSLILFDKIYTETYELLQNADGNSNLQIIKIESGSKSLDLLGNKYVLDFIKWILKSCAKFIYDNFTTSGKISKVNGNLVAIDAQIGVIEKITELNSKLTEENQINIEDSMEYIEKSVVLITKKTNELLGKQTKLKIDDDTISLNKELEMRFIEETEKLYLDSPK